MLGNRNQPTELSFVSQTSEDISGDDIPDETLARSSGDGEEERNLSQSKQSHAQRGSLQDREPDPNSTMHHDPNNVGAEMEEVTFTVGYTSSKSKDPQANAPPFTRCYSEQMTPRTQRKLQKSYSVTPLIPLKSGIKLELFIQFTLLYRQTMTPV